MIGGYNGVMELASGDLLGVTLGVTLGDATGDLVGREMDMYISQPSFLALVFCSERIIQWFKVDLFGCIRAEASSKRFGLESLARRRRTFFALAQLRSSDTTITNSMMNFLFVVKR
jgi:hypothetical protein